MPNPEKTKNVPRDLAKIAECRDALANAADLMQQILDGNTSQCKAAGKLGITPQIFSRNLAKGFAPYIRSHMPGGPELVRLINDARSPGDRFLLDILYRDQENFAEENLIVLPPYVEKNLWAVARERLNEREYNTAAFKCGHGPIGDQEPMSIADIARDMVVTRERVRQIYRKALQKMRHPRTLPRIFSDLTPIMDDYSDLISKNFDMQLNRLLDTEERFRQAAIMSEAADVLMQAEKHLAERMPDRAARIIIDKFPPKYRDDAKAMPVVALADADPSVRTYNCLTRAGIDNLNQLVDMPVDEIMRIRNLGRTSLKEIHKLLLEYLKVDRKDIAAKCA